MNAMMKKIMFSAVLFSLVLLLSGTVYALGGGGSNGDGRLYYLPKASTAGNPNTADSQNAQGGSSEGTAGNGSIRTLNSTFADAVAVPEPVALLLLGLGLSGLAAVTRRK